MTQYTLEVTTGSMLDGCTFDNLYVTLIGTERQSERTQLTSFGLDDKAVKVSCKTMIIITIRLAVLYVFFFSLTENSSLMEIQYKTSVGKQFSWFWKKLFICDSSYVRSKCTV